MGMSAIMYTMRQYIYVMLQVCHHNLVNFIAVEKKNKSMIYTCYVLRKVYSVIQIHIFFVQCFVCYAFVVCMSIKIGRESGWKNMESTV